ncbi:MAG: DUF2007 domain-containing protein [Myxococcota bacterium]|jgi:hypothetical protein|nr:DUF2007 domain-containing protein [Myxococcota bacterium]
MSEDFDREDMDEQDSPEGSNEEMLDLYRCYEHQEALRLMDLLEEKNIEALLRDRSASAFPTSVGMTSQQIIAVSQNDRAGAQALIEAAVRDEIVSSEGIFISDSE